MTYASPPILYVEDNVDHAELFLRSWREHGARAPVIHVEDGEAALHYLTRVEAEEAQTPRLVVLDLRLPRVDGFEVLARFKASQQAVPVVILTTSASERDIARAFAQQANSYVVKPEDVGDLDALIRDLARWWFIWNEPEGGP